MAHFSRKNTKKEKNDFFESFSKFLIFFQEILELKKGLKNTEKKPTNKSGKYARFSRKIVHVSQNKRRKVKEDEESNNEVGSTLEQGDH